MSDAANLTRALSGHWMGHYGMARCPAHDDRNPSLSVADSTAGGLLLKCHAGCSYAAIRAALRSGGHLHAVGANLDSAPDPAGEATRRQEAERRARRRETQAQEIWREAEPIQGTPAETYLRRRGITCALPANLVYAPACWHPTARRLPALLARLTGTEGFAVHRTYLAPDGTGKASIAPAKAMLGATKGGAVPLSNGNDRLVIAEGIETALSLLSGLIPGSPTVWAALSASGVTSLRLPSLAGKLTIAPDGDPVGRAAAERLAYRAEALGWRVSLLPAPDGQDWNDVLMGKAVRA